MQLLHGKSHLLIPNLIPLPTKEWGVCRWQKSLPTSELQLFMGGEALSYQRLSIDFIFTCIEMIISCYVYLVAGRISKMIGNRYASLHVNSIWNTPDHHLKTLLSNKCSQFIDSKSRTRQTHIDVGHRAFKLNRNSPAICVLTFLCLDNKPCLE